MKLIDETFRDHKLGYIFQCVLAGVAMAAVLAALVHISDSAVIASLGASVFIVFALPQTESSRPRFLIGGYAIGILGGSLCYWLRCTLAMPEQLWFIHTFPQVVFGALAVALVSFLMVVGNYEHPPAAGLALGFALMEEWYWITPLAVLVGIIALCLMKIVLKPILRNLL